MRVSLVCALLVASALAATPAEAAGGAHRATRHHSHHSRGHSAPREIVQKPQAALADEEKCMGEFQLVRHTSMQRRLRSSVSAASRMGALEWFLSGACRIHHGLLTTPVSVLIWCVSARRAVSACWM